MPKENQGLPDEQRAKVIAILNRRLADAIDLQLQRRQAYWNVKGPSSLALRQLFDQVAQGVEEHANLLAERLVQLGGVAEATARAVAGRSALDGSGVASADGKSHLAALATALTEVSRHARYAAVQASELHDADTAALLTEIRCGIDTWLWYVQTSQHPGN